MRILFIITLTACLFYISQAKAHDTKQVLDDETARLIHLVSPIGAGSETIGKKQNRII